MIELLHELLARCRRGDEDAVETLVSRFRNYAYDLAKAIVEDDHLAEDAVQEAFMAAISRLQDLRDPDAFPGWFRQVVRTQANRIARRRRESTGVDTTERPSGDLSPASHLEKRELRELVRQALAALPEKSRETAALFYLEERHHLEVAELLRVPPGTVKRRLHDARQRLRDILLGYMAPIEPAAARQPDQDLPL